MDLRPWGYLTRDGQLYEETKQVQASLEYVIAKHETPSGRAAPVDPPLGIDRSRNAPKPKPIGWCR